MSNSLALRVRNLSRIMVSAIAVVVFSSDQVTKTMVESSIPEHSVIPIFRGFFNLTHIKNTGAAFGLFADSPAAWKTALLIAISCLLLGTVATIVWRNQKLHWEAGIGLALILGGALSNLLDRLRTGKVVDFLDFYYRGHHWPAFNLADSAIVVGAAFLILQVIFTE